MLLSRQLASCRIFATRRTCRVRLPYKHYSQRAPRLEQPFDILFFGRDEFSCLVLQELHKAQGRYLAKLLSVCINVFVDVWEQLALVTQPDMKTGRRGSILSICG